jgi:hypothetical protein
VEKKKKMAAKTYTQETLETFHNVRIGGPKEKRLRRVELMGEHQPKRIFYIKVTQQHGEEYLTIPQLLAEFARSIIPIIFIVFHYWIFVY